jgi:hypothetical protein
MLTMGATVIDVAREYGARIAPFPLVHAFMLYDGRRNTIMFTTFFENVDPKAENALAEIDAYMLDSFPEYALDFRTIHLMGRDVTRFIPDGAVPLTPTRGPALHRAAH